MLEHGGRLRIAAQERGIPLADWLDLSTGINPFGWKPPAVPDSVWQRLPEEEDGLEEAATSYYGCGNLLPVPGSQSAIQALPHLRAKRIVGVVHPIYQEHPQAWREQGHQILEFSFSEVDDYLKQLDVLILCNPNNPDGRLIPKSLLLSWAGILAEKGGWLIVDEAFMDALPNEHSLLDNVGHPGLIILRSLGKFFGLAGARVGFVMGERSILDRLKASIGPWPISGPSRWIACQALMDRAWQKIMRITLDEQAVRAQKLLRTAGFSCNGEALLFQFIECPDSESVREAFLTHAILIRHFSGLGAIRLGLPGNVSDWLRLEAVIHQLNNS
ncbi:MAG: threonine-phosphate decarboxylase CobD [Sedimenticola sp.]|nr:threonine-phosphate decarboxylase CobD [Sedimenticola sp.]